MRILTEVAELPERTAAARCKLEEQVCCSHGIDYERSGKKDLGKRLISITSNDGLYFMAWVTDLTKVVRFNA